MTIIPAIIIGSVVYSVYEYITYHPEYKDANWTLLVGLVCVFIANTVWIFLTKSTLDPSVLLKYSMYWGVMITILSVAIPMMFFGAKVTGIQALGMALAIGGLMIMRV